MEIKNKTKRPLRVPLQGGKRLHLGPGKTGQVTSKALEHPPVAALIEAGDLEVLDIGHKHGLGASSGAPGTGDVRQAGDR
ncbi:MAG: hypothetical protein R3F49_12425 [Planctomycetota bacterium]